MYAWGHLRMKKNKSRPLIKTQLAKIVVIQVAILLAFLVLFTVKETDQTLLIWRNTNARTCQSLLNEYQSDLKQAAAVTAYPVQPVFIWNFHISLRNTARRLR
mgnify:CR=1 FL=1